MTKMTVETTGPFQLVDRFTRTLIAHDKPTEVEVTPFVTERLEAGELREVGVPDRENETPSEPELTPEGPERENSELEPEPEPEQTEATPAETPKPRGRRRS